jgi:hypothetical protein
MTHYHQVGVEGMRGAGVEHERHPAIECLELHTEQALDVDGLAVKLICDGCLAGEIMRDHRPSGKSEAAEMKLLCILVLADEELSHPSARECLSMVSHVRVLGSGLCGV